MNSVRSHGEAGQQKPNASRARSYTRLFSGTRRRAAPWNRAGAVSNACLRTGGGVACQFVTNVDAKLARLDCERGRVPLPLAVGAAAGGLMGRMPPPTLPSHRPASALYCSAASETTTTAASLATRTRGYRPM
jgi:hypothetical protein